MPDRLAEIRARLDAIGPDWIVSATGVRQLMSDAQWMLERVGFVYRDSEQGKRAAVLLQWFHAHPPVTGAGFALYRVRDLVNDARWLLTVVSDVTTPHRTLSRPFATAAERDAALLRWRKRNA